MLAGLVFLASFALPDTTATGFLRAAAEAGMVGGLADWFAVTALFRHPLGLRIPHTALVPRKKDELATKLGEFVHGNFLTPDAVAGQLAESRLVPRVAERLAEPRNASRIGAELATAVAAALDAVDPRDVTDAVLELARRDLARRSYTPVLGHFLARAVEGQGQQPLVDLCVTRLRMHVVRERDVLRPLLMSYLESQGRLFWLFTTDARVDTLLMRAVDLLGEVEQDPDHPARRWLDGLLARARGRPALRRRDGAEGRRPAAGAGRGPAPAVAAARRARRPHRVGAHVAGRPRRRAAGPAERTGAGGGPSGAVGPRPAAPHRRAALGRRPLRGAALRRRRRRPHLAHRPGVGRARRVRPHRGRRRP